jgi:hypothetical protein
MMLCLGARISRFLPSKTEALVRNKWTNVTHCVDQPQTGC